MPRQNRVTPFGELEAVPARGLFLGNRGCLHTDAGKIIRMSTTKGWIVCVLQFKDRKRTPLMQPGKYTELFFLDEPTAFAAGHRPCAECRRADFNRFRDAVAADEGRTEKLLATQMDNRLDAERRDGTQRRTVDRPVQTLPSGAMVDIDGEAHLWWDGTLRPWTHLGYGVPTNAPRLPIPVLTPATTLAALHGGYRPVVHPSIEN
jgi:hypothetical protein